MPLSKDQAASKIQRLIRRWTWALTVPPAVAGPKLIRWAKVWRSKRDQTPANLLQEAEQEQRTIRSNEWKKLNEKNDLRHAAAERRSQTKADRTADDRETAIVTLLLKDLLLKTTDRILLEVVHDELDLEPPAIEEEEEEDDGSSNNNNNASVSVDKKLKRRKSSYKSKQRKKLIDIINKSNLLTKADKSVAALHVDSVKSQQDRGLFLCALLTNASPNARLRLIESAMAASKANKTLPFDEQSRAQYRQVITNCSKLREVNRKTALKAIDSISSHELSGAILQALLEGASPYTMLALCNVGDSNNNTSPPNSPKVGGKKTLAKTNASEQKNSGDDVDYGDANEPVSQKMCDAIKNALANRKASTISYGQHCAAVYAHKLLKTNMHATQLVLNIILDADGSVIRSSCFTKASSNVWTDREKKGFLRFLQNDCDLSSRQLPAAVRAVEHSKLKTQIQALLMQQVKVAVCNQGHAKNESKNNGSSSSGGNAPLAKADPSSKCTSADRDAASFAMQANASISRDQKHAFKMAIKKTTTMADLFLLVNCILMKGTPEMLLSCLASATINGRTVDEQKKMAQDSLSKTDMVQGPSKAAAIATIKMDECKTSKLILAVCEAAISGKLPKEIKEALSCTTDGDKVALLTILNSCVQNKDPTKVEALKTAKNAAMKAKSYGEQALILQLVLSGVDARTLKKTANRAAVDGTRQQIHVSEEQKKMVVELVDGMVDDEKSKIHADHSMVVADALPDVTEGSQLVKLMGAILLTVKPTIIRKMAEAWAPKDEFGKPMRKNTLEGLNAKQKKCGLDIIKNISWLAASDKGVALDIAEGCKHQLTMLLLFVAILDGRPARVLKKLQTDIRNMNPTVVPQNDAMTPTFRTEILSVIERAKNGPIGAKRGGAVRAVEKSDRASITLAVIASLINNQSVYQIVGARALGVDAQIDDRTKQAMLEDENKEKNQAEAEREKKFGCILHSTVHSDNQKAAGLVALKKARSSPMRCEVLLALLAHATPEYILNSVNKRGISRGFHGQEQKEVLKAVAESTLWQEHKQLAAKLVSNATTKQELVIILEKAVGWLEHVTEEDKQKFRKAIDACKNLAEIDSEAQGKKLYLLQWLEKVNTKMQLFVLQLVALDWQNEALHWTGVAYERIFSDSLPEPLVPSTIELTKEAIKKVKNPKPQKKAARQMITKAQEQQDIIEVLNKVIGSAKPKLIRNSFTMPDKSWVRVSREELVKKYTIASDPRLKKKNQLEAKQRREAQQKKEEEIVIDTRVLDEEVDLLDQKLDFDETLTKRQKFAIRKCLKPESCDTMPIFDAIARLSKLMSPAHRAKDKNAKNEVPSEIFKQVCIMLIRNDPKASDSVKDGADGMILRVKVNTVYRLGEVVRSITKESFTEVKRVNFQWGRPGVSTSEIDAEDLRNIVAYIRGVPGLLPEERLAAKEAVERACKLRCEVEEILTIVEADIDNGDGISNKRKYTIAARQIENRRKEEMLRNQPSAEEVQRKKDKKMAYLEDKKQKEEMKKVQNEQGQQKVIAIFKEVADHIHPNLGHRQRVVALRIIGSSTCAHDRCKIIEAILLSMDALTMKTCLNTFDSVENRMDEILSSANLPADIWQKASEQVSMLDNNSSSSNNNDGSGGGGGGGGGNSSSNGDYFEDMEGILCDVMSNLSSHKVEKLSAKQAKTAAPELVTEGHRSAMIATFHAMQTFTIERKRCLEEALETLATYSQLCNVLLAVVSDLSNESITMASNAQHSSNLSADALPHIKELMRNSHMMEYTSGPKHADIVHRVMESKSHYDLSIALFDAVEEHATIMQGMYRKTIEHTSDI